MKLKNLATALLFVTIILPSCKKDGIFGINTSQIHKTDFFGNAISSPNDNQWNRQAFSNKELALFNRLDTVSLAGTIALEPTGKMTAFPNYFANNFFLAIGANNPENKAFILKWVLVNNRRKILVSGWNKINKDNNIVSIQSDHLSNGNYRLYFTLSAEGKPHYFTSWGNVQKGE